MGGSRRRRVSATAPAGTPAALIARINDEAKQIVAQEDYRRQMHAIKVEAVATRLNIAVQPLPVRGPADFEAAFQAAAKNRAGGLITSPRL